MGDSTLSSAVEPKPHHPMQFSVITKPQKNGIRLGQYLTFSFFLYSPPSPSPDPVGWGCRIRRLHLYRGVKLPQWVSWINTKQSNGEAPVIVELWGMQSTPLLSLLPGSFWFGVVSLDRVLSIGQIELNRVLMLNWIVWNCFDI